MKATNKLSLIIFCLVINFFISAKAFCGNIVIYGDSQQNPDAQRKLVQTIISFKPSVVFRVGDLVQDGFNQEHWNAFNEIHGPLIKSAEYFPALGNHEHDSPLYFKNFPFLENKRWYSVDRQGIHFIVLDTNSRFDSESGQYKWLKSDLASVDKIFKFKIVLFHHPIFDVSQVHRSDEKSLKEVLLPLLQEYGVCAVFSGHSHDYQRFEYEGMNFVVTGGGGSNLYGQSRENQYLKKFVMAYHFCLLTPEEDSLAVKVIDIDGNIIDDFKIAAGVTQQAVLAK